MFPVNTMLHFSNGCGRPFFTCQRNWTDKVWRIFQRQTWRRMIYLGQIKKEKIASFVSKTKISLLLSITKHIKLKKKKGPKSTFSCLSNTSWLRPTNRIGKIQVFWDILQYICIRWNIKPRKEKKWHSCAVAKLPAAKRGTRRHPNKWYKKSYYFWCNCNY